MKNFDSLLSAFLHWEKTIPDNILFKQPFKDGKKEYSYKESGRQIRAIAAHLQSLNLEPESKIALISKNCAHWIMSDIAIMMAGFVSVPIYPTLDPKTIGLILKHSEAKLIIVGKLDDYEVQKPGITDIPIIGVKNFGITDGTAWEDIIKNQEPMTEITPRDGESLMTIMYTSGTTGMPKGVMHTISNIATISNTLLETLALPKNPRMFSYLPLSHIAERVGIEMQSMWRGATITFPHSLESFPADLSATQPNVFFAVPRIWAKFQEKILEKMPQKKLDLFLKLPILKNIVKKKIQTSLGLSDARYIATGAAPIAVSLLEWFSKLDIEIMQVYGMTEDALMSHFSLPSANKKGAVGKTLKGATVKISEEGEICIKSACTMKGYYKEPEITAETFDDEGYLKTGDIGEFDSEGYLYITGRIKDQFKTDKGKYIAPAPIELELMKSPEIEQICIVGSGLPQPIALITLSEPAKGMDKDSCSGSLSKSLTAINETLAKHEKIEKAVVLKEEWTLENGLMTPTLKVKRNVLEKKHNANYKSWYDEKARIIFE